MPPGSDIGLARYRTAARIKHVALRCALLWALAILSALPARGDAQGARRAGVVVRTGKGEVKTACVEFAGPSIDGLTLLQLAGFDVNIQPSGNNATICSVDGEGCTFPRETCFCRCQGNPCIYWGYWRLLQGAWKISQLGAPVYQVKPGEVDGWAWGAAQPPPVIGFDAICKAPTATVAATPTTETTLTPVELAATVAATAAGGRTEAPAALTAVGERTEAPVTLAASTPPPDHRAGNKSPASYGLFLVTVLCLLATIGFVSRRRMR